MVEAFRNFEVSLAARLKSIHCRGIPLAQGCKRLYSLSELLPWVGELLLAGEDDPATPSN